MTQQKSMIGNSTVFSSKTLVGIVVFGVLLFAMLMGAGALGRADDKPVNLADRSAKERSEFAVERGDWTLACDAFAEMVREDPFDARSMFYLAYSHQQLGQFDKARPWYEKASEYSRFRPWSLYNRASINAKENDLTAALKDLSTAIEGGFVTRRGIQQDRDFEPIKDTAEFLRLVEIEEKNRDKKRGFRRSR